jgi:preprotein translocase subunit SecD
MEFSAKTATLGIALMCCVGQVAPTGQHQSKFELRLAEKEPGEGLTEFSVPESTEKIYVHKEVVVTNEDIAEVRVVRSYAGASYDIQIDFTEEGAQRIGKATEENIGKQLALILDGKVVSAPMIASKISSTGAISGRFTKEEAEGIAIAIRPAQKN